MVFWSLAGAAGPPPPGHPPPGGVGPRVMGPIGPMGPMGPTSPTGPMGPWGPLGHSELIQKPVSEPGSFRVNESSLVVICVNIV